MNGLGSRSIEFVNRESKLLFARQENKYDKSDSSSRTPTALRTGIERIVP